MRVNVTPGVSNLTQRFNHSSPDEVTWHEPIDGIDSRHRSQNDTVWVSSAFRVQSHVFQPTRPVIKKRLRHRRRPPHPLSKLRSLRYAAFRFPKFQTGVHETRHYHHRMLRRGVQLLRDLPRDHQMFRRVIIQIRVQNIWIQRRQEAQKRLVHPRGKTKHLHRFISYRVRNDDQSKIRAQRTEKQRHEQRAPRDEKTNSRYSLWPQRTITTISASSSRVLLLRVIQRQRPSRARFVLRRASSSVLLFRR